MCTKSNSCQKRASHLLERITLDRPGFSEFSVSRQHYSKVFESTGSVRSKMLSFPSSGAQHLRAISMDSILEAFSHTRIKIQIIAVSVKFRQSSIACSGKTTYCGANISCFGLGTTPERSASNVSCPGIEKSDASPSRSEWRRLWKMASKSRVMALSSF
jgi:hypothetical protein